MKKLLKILPIAILMAGIVACSPETETTSSSSSAKPTSSSQVETKPSSSEETPISSESTEGTVSSEESTTGGDSTSSSAEEDNRSIEVLASEFNVPEAGWADNLVPPLHSALFLLSQRKCSLCHS